VDICMCGLNAVQINLFHKVELFDATGRPFLLVKRRLMYDSLESLAVSFSGFWCKNCF